MAYSATGLNLMVPHVGDGPGIWVYISDDVHTDVDADNYFADGDDRGMKLYDTVIVHDNTTPWGATLHQVRTVTAGGAASISLAILA